MKKGKIYWFTIDLVSFLLLITILYYLAIWLNGDFLIMLVVMLAWRVWRLERQHGQVKLEFKNQDDMMTVASKVKSISFEKVE